MLKKTLLVVFLVGVSAGVSGMVVSSYITKREEAKGRFEAGILSMQLEFIRNNSLLRPITDNQGRADLQKYIMEANTLMGWYQKNVSTPFWNQHPDKYDPESIIKEKRSLAENEGPNRQSAKNNLPIHEECYEIVRAIYNQFKDTSYSAVASDFQGSIRFDVHKVIREDNKLKWIVVIWGGIGSVVYNGWHMKWFKAPTAEQKAEYEKALAKSKKNNDDDDIKDPATMHFAESTSSVGRPVLPDFEGSQYVADFPAGAIINYFYTSSCPPDSERLEIEFKLGTRSLTGDDQRMSFMFSLPVENAWKGNWQGVQEVEATSDYE